MINAIIGGLISGLISPMIVSFFQHKIIWKTQKKLEIKYSIFNDAIRALSLLSVDSLNPELQSINENSQDMQRQTKLHPETDQLMEKSRGMVQAFFSNETFSTFENALKTNISIKNVPNTEFEANRVKAILELSKELGISK